MYLSQVKEDLGKFTERAFWTGSGSKLVNQPLAKNIVSAVLHELASSLGIENSKEFKFHSFRCSFATTAADNCATAQQIVDFYGWKSASMAQEYISASKKAVQNMANMLKPESSVELHLKQF